MAEHDAITVAGNLPCVGCGMCCNGTLFWRERVAQGEEERARAHGLTLIRVNGASFFKLPCRFEAHGRCAIYESRFDQCRSFRCRLLREYQSGQVDADVARRRVETALRLAETVKSDDPAAARAFERRSVRARLVDAPENESPAEKRERMRRLLNNIALDTYLERWFRHPPKESSEAEAETADTRA